MAKLTPDILDAIVEAFDRAGGVDYLTELALRDPPTFCQLLGKVVQSEIRATISIETSTIILGEAMVAAERRLISLDHEQ